MGGLLPKYFKSEWSYAQMKTEGRAICAFSEDSTRLVAVTNDGTYTIAEIPKSGGECVTIEKKSIVSMQ